jgi:hypothetical protein
MRDRPLKVDRCFGGTCRPHYQGSRKNQARNKGDASSKQSGYEEFCLPGKVTVFQQMKNFSELLWNPTVHYPEKFYHLTDVSE